VIDHECHVLELATSIEDFVAAPKGRYVCGQNFVYGCFDDDLFAACLWGDVVDVAMLVSAYEAETRTQGTHTSLFDASKIDHVDRASYVPLTEFIHRRRSELSAHVRSVALVRPGGLVGIVVTGFRDLLDPIPTELFVDRVEALKWLGRPDATARAAELEALATYVEGGSAIVRTVRALLASDVATWTVASVARKLGLTQRTLQRRLKEANTTFGAEYRAAQVRTAERLLRDTNTNLTAIALEVGCGSLQQFSTLFRRVNGTSPSLWRARPKP
jgi:AraC-like DNA-binding protein